MKKPKHKYDVFIVGKGTGVYAEDYCNKFVGQTWAVSEKQACNNARFNLRDDEYPNGGYAEWVLGDIYDEGMVTFRYEAKLSN